MCFKEQSPCHALVNLKLNIVYQAMQWSTTVFVEILLKVHGVAHTQPIVVSLSSETGHKIPPNTKPPRVLNESSQHWWPQEEDKMRRVARTHCWQCQGLKYIIYYGSVCLQTVTLNPKHTEDKQDGNHKKTTNSHVRVTENQRISRTNSGINWMKCTH